MDRFNFRSQFSLRDPRRTSSALRRGEPWHVEPLRPVFSARPIEELPPPNFADSYLNFDSPNLFRRDQQDLSAEPADNSDGSSRILSSQPEVSRGDSEIASSDDARDNADVSRDANAEEEEVVEIGQRESEERLNACYANIDNVLSDMRNLSALPDQLQEELRCLKEQVLEKNACLLKMKESSSKMAEELYQTEQSLKNTKESERNAKRHIAQLEDDLKSWSSRCENLKTEVKSIQEVLDSKEKEHDDKVKELGLEMERISSENKEQRKEVSEKNIVISEKTKELDYVQHCIEEQVLIRKKLTSKLEEQTKKAQDLHELMRVEKEKSVTREESQNRKISTLECSYTELEKVNRAHEECRVALEAKCSSVEKELQCFEETANNLVGDVTNQYNLLAAVEKHLHEIFSSMDAICEAEAISDDSRVTSVIPGTEKLGESEISQHGEKIHTLKETLKLFEDLLRAFLENVIRRAEIQSQYIDGTTLSIRKFQEVESNAWAALRDGKSILKTFQDSLQFVRAELIAHQSKFNSLFTQEAETQKIVQVCIEQLDTEHEQVAQDLTSCRQELQTTREEHISVLEGKDNATEKLRSELEIERQQRLEDAKLLESQRKISEASHAQHSTQLADLEKKLSSARDTVGDLVASRDTLSKDLQHCQRLLSLAEEKITSTQKEAEELKKCSERQLADVISARDIESGNRKKLEQQMRLIEEEKAIAGKNLDICKSALSRAKDDLTCATNLALSGKVSADAQLSTIKHERDAIAQDLVTCRKELAAANDRLVTMTKKELSSDQAEKTGCEVISKDGPVTPSRSEERRPKKRLPPKTAPTAPKTRRTELGKPRNTGKGKHPKLSPASARVTRQTSIASKASSSRADDEDDEDWVLTDKTLG